MLLLFSLLFTTAQAWQLVSGPITTDMGKGSDTNFGSALCLEGTTLGIGAESDDYYYDYAGRAGAIYVANEDVLQAKLFGNGQKPRGLGASCTINNGILVAGAPDANQVLTWTTAVDPPEILTGGAGFGSKVDGWQDYLLIMSPLEINYYRRRQNAWQLRDTEVGNWKQTKFSPDGAWVIATSGLTIEIFERRNQRLRPEFSIASTLGRELDAGNNCFIVGDTRLGAPPGGEAEIFEYDGTTWTQTAVLNPPSRFQFGKAVTISNQCDRAVACGQLFCATWDKVNGTWSMSDSFSVQNVNSIVSTPAFDRLYVGNIIIGGKYYIFE
jgi:hypothetical protein